MFHHLDEHVCEHLPEHLMIDLCAVRCCAWRACTAVGKEEFGKVSRELFGEVFGDVCREVLA